MAQPSDIDYLALAEQLIAMPRSKRRMLRIWVSIMADDGKRSATGSVLLLVAAALTIGAAWYFEVPPAAFVMILIGGAIMAIVAWAIYRKLL